MIFKWILEKKWEKTFWAYETRSWFWIISGWSTKLKVDFGKKNDQLFSKADEWDTVEVEISPTCRAWKDDFYNTLTVDKVEILEVQPVNDWWLF